MAEFSIDRFVDSYAKRAAGMTASEVRALFAVAARPEVVSLAGGMPFVQALPSTEVIAVANEVLTDTGDVALQYGGGQGTAIAGPSRDSRSRDDSGRAGFQQPDLDRQGAGSGQL